jgi:hypothetical protein
MTIREGRNLRMRRQWMILGFAALLFGLAARFLSSGRAEVQKEDRKEKEYETVLVHRACAPWDGPAVEIEFYASPARCGRPQASNLRIALWRNLPPKAGQKIEFKGDRPGVASFCPQENQCEAAKSGTVEIESYEESKGASGRYDLEFTKAGRMTGRFRATWCAMRFLCG